MPTSPSPPLCLSLSLSVSLSLSLTLWCLSLSLSLFLLHFSLLVSSPPPPALYPSLSVLATRLIFQMALFDFSDDDFEDYENNSIRDGPGPGMVELDLGFEGGSGVVDLGR